MSLASPYGRGAPEGGGEGIVIFLKKITSPQAITSHFPENQKNSNIFLIALSVTPYGVPALPKGEPSRLCCKLNNNFLTISITKARRTRVGPPLLFYKKGLPQTIVWGSPFEFRGD